MTKKKQSESKNEFTFGTDPDAFNDDAAPPAEPEPEPAPSRKPKPDKYEVHSVQTVNSAQGYINVLRLVNAYPTGNEASKAALAEAKLHPGTRYIVSRKLESIVVEEVTTAKVVRS
jgi:hypothetical protein